MKRYDQELFKLALPCLSAVAGALPPDYMESNYMAMMEKQSSMDSEGNFTPRPADTAKYAWSFFFLFFSTPHVTVAILKLFPVEHQPAQLHEVFCKVAKIIMYQQKQTCFLICCYQCYCPRESGLFHYQICRAQPWKVVSRKGNQTVSSNMAVVLFWDILYLSYVLHENVDLIKYLYSIIVFQWLVIWGKDLWNL